MRYCALSGRPDFGIFVREYPREPFLADPLGVFDFLWIDRDVPIKGRAAASQHEGCRKRPGLAGKIPDLTHLYARLFKDLAADGRLDCFARLNESGQKGIHPIGPTRGPAQKDVVAMGDQHDDNRIGPGKMVAATGRTVALPARHGHDALGPAACTEAMGLVPAQYGLGRRGKLCFARIKARHHRA